jgi:hypothetical protein
MKNKILPILALLFLTISFSFVSAHDTYYDNHRHIDTDPVDNYRYYEDNYYRYNFGYIGYPQRNYYSEYDGRYYYEDNNYYYNRYRGPIYTPQLARSYGHGVQTVQFRLDHYYNDHGRYPRYRYQSPTIYLDYNSRTIDRGIPHYYY